MKNKSSNPTIKDKREAENISKSKDEINKVRPLIQEIFPSAETIAIDPEFKELSFYVDSATFDSMQKNINKEKISLTFIKSDKDSIALYFKYALL